MKDMKIVAAAILHGGHVYTLPAPARHYDIVCWMRDTLGLECSASTEEGFLTDSAGSLSERWVRRVPARMIAINAGQVKEERTTHPRQLFSEDLW